MTDEHGVVISAVVGDEKGPPIYYQVTCICPWPGKVVDTYVEATTVSTAHLRVADELAAEMAEAARHK